MRRGVVLVLAAAALLLGTLVVDQLSGARRPMRQLARMNPVRPFAPRLSIPTEFHACDTVPPRRGDVIPRVTCGSSDPGSLDLPGLDDADNSTDPTLLRASGLAAIIWPDSADDQALGNAISRLQKALRLSPRRVPLLIDLSAAHMLRAEREQNPYDLLLAINYADEAVALEPGSPEARYNAALARQAFALDETAAHAWDAYLALDSTSEWAEEARARKRDLITEPIEILKPAPGASVEEITKFAKDYPQEAREYGWLEVLPRWCDALEDRNAAEAAALLRLAGGLGHALETQSRGDASLADAVAAIRAAESDPAALRALARGHREFAVASAYFAALETDSAVAALASIAALKPPSTVLLQWTALIQAGTRWYSGDSIAIPDLRALLDKVDRSRHPVFTGRAQLMLGTILLRRERHAEAIEQLRPAQENLRRTGESERYGAALSVEGEVAYEQGDTIAAYQTLHRAQRTLRPYRQSNLLHNQLVAVSTYAADDGMPRAALAILNEDVRVARREGTAVRLLDGLQRRSRVNASIGDALGAERDWDSAAEIPLPEDKAQQNWAKAALHLASPDSVSGAELNAALRALAGNELWLVTAFGRAAEVRIAEGDLVGASRDLEFIVAKVVESPGPLEGALLEQARNSFDRLVMLYLRMGKPIAALHTLERGRLSFAPQQDSATAARDSAVATRDTLRAPAGHVALEYALIGDTLLTWVLRGDSLRVVRQTVDRQAFVLMVDQVGAALELPDAPVPMRALRRLYDQLIRPVRASLGPAETPLVILADGEVAGVPFAALMDGNRYLVEDYPLRVAATLADAAYQAPPRASTGPALLVADPAFDKSAYPALFPLEWARMEVDSLVPFYPRNVQLRGDTATRDTFVASAQVASVIHYAGHAVFDDTRPERSYLVLVGADTTGRLTAEAVRGLRLANVRLVVLSACRTQRSREGRSGGFAGLSGALLAAEAGGVVGSLWQVSDELTAPLMKEFHDQFQESGDPALALRNAQLEMLHSDVDPRLNSPAAWAGFRYTGAQRP